MTDKAIKYTNCEISKINFTHVWSNPEFGVWIKENEGKWLDGCPFSPAQGIQLQIKILRTVGNTVLIFLKNCGHTDIALAKWLVAVTFGDTFSDQEEDECNGLDCTNSRQTKKCFVLSPNKLSEEFKLNLDEPSRAAWNHEFSGKLTIFLRLQIFKYGREGVYFYSVP